MTAALNGAPRSSDTPVEVSVGAGWSTATAGTDFATVSDFTVTIAAGTLSQTATFTLEPTDDDVDEGYFESVAVSGTSTVATFTVIGTAVNILDDDDRGVTVSDSSLTVKEGNSETYTVVLDSRPTGDVSVTPSRTSGDADVTVSGALTFTPDNWSSAQAVTVRAAEDLDGDDDTAEIGHAVNGGDYGSAAAPSVTVTVDDDEFASRGVLLSANIKEVLESAGATTITVTAALNGAPRSSDTPVEVSVGAGWSTATSGTDFATVSDFTVTIAAGTLSQIATFTLEPTDDDVDEGYFESVAVSGTSTVATFSVIGTAVNILDDDDRGVTVSEEDLTVNEGSTGTYTVVLDSRPTGDVSVTPSRTSGDADVTVSGALTFTPDNWSSAQAVTVSAAEDLDTNDDTAEIGHTVSGGDYGSETARSVTVTVTDDEVASTGVLLSVNIKEVLESASATTITVTATLNGVSRSSTTPVVVSVGTGTATSGIDFATVNDFTITIGTGTLSQTATFTLEPTDDDVDEDNETVAVSGTTTVATFTVTGTAVNIVDDDLRGVRVSDASLTVNEGSTDTYTVVLDSRPTGDVTVTPSRSSGDADVTVSGALTFTPDNWSSAQAVTVSAADDLDSNDDTAEIGHTVNGGDYGSETARSVTVTVTDDESASTGVLLSVDNQDVGESAGATTIKVTAALNGGSRSSATPVEVSVGAGTSTATSGIDFTTVSNFTITIGAGTRSQTATFTLAPTDDDVDEDNETVAVSGTTTVATFTVTGTAVNILDDDDRGVTVPDASLTVNEGSTGTYTVVLDSKPTGNVTVTPSRSSGDTDVTVSGALTFTPDNWSSAQAVTVSAAEDLDSNNDTAVIGHAVSGGDYGSETARSVTVTVTDDESASRGVLLSANIKEVLESAGATTITVTATLNGGARSSATPVVVSVGTGTATAGIDFATVNDFTITIGTGTLSQTATFTLDPTDDDVDEDNETVAVSGTTTVANFTVTGTAVNIVDDDDRGVTVSDADLTVNEGSTDTYTVVLDSKPTGNVTVTPSRSSGDADVTVSGALTFTPDNWSSAQAVTVRAAEDLDGDDDTAEIGHAVNGGDYGSAAAPSVTVTVDDDEFASRGVLLSANIKEVLESAGATTITVTAALNGAPRSSDTPVEVSVGAGWSTATSGTDFATVSDFTVTIGAGTLSQTATFTLEPTDDDVDEGYFESVAVSGTSTVATFSVIGTAVNILDDDDRGVTVSDSSLTVKEGNSDTYTVVLDSRPTGDVTVTPSRTSGDADVTVSGALTFTPDNWSSAQAVTVRAAEDLDGDDDTAEIGHAVNGGDYGSAAAPSVTVTVDDDEFASRGVLLSANIKEVLESAGATTITVTAALNGAPRSSDTPVEVSVGAGWSTATAGTDFATVSDFTVTIGAGTLSQTATFTLEPTDDDVDEGYFESVAVSGTSTVATFSVIGTAVNILDDDDRGVTVSDLSLTVKEGSSEHLHGGAGFEADRRCECDAVENERGCGRDGERCADFYAGQLVERAGGDGERGRGPGYERRHGGDWPHSQRRRLRIGDGAFGDGDRDRRRVRLDGSAAVGEHQGSPGVRRRHHDHGDGDAERRRALKRHAG